MVRDKKNFKTVERNLSPGLTKKKKATTVELLAQKLERMEERMNQFTTGGVTTKKTKEQRRKPSVNKRPAAGAKAATSRLRDDNRVSRCSSNSTLVPAVSSIYPERSTNSEEESEGGFLETPLTHSIWSPEPAALMEKHRSGAKTARKRSISRGKKNTTTRQIQYVDEMSDNTTVLTNISISHVKGKKRGPTNRSRTFERERSGSCQRVACPGYRDE